MRKTQKLSFGELQVNLTKEDMKSKKGGNLFVYTNNGLVAAVGSMDNFNGEAAGYFGKYIDGFYAAVAAYGQDACLGVGFEDMEDIVLGSRVGGITSGYDSIQASEASNDLKGLGWSQKTYVEDMLNAALEMNIDPTYLFNALDDASNYGQSYDYAWMYGDLWQKGIEDGMKNSSGYFNDAMGFYSANAHQMPDAFSYFSSVPIPVQDGESCVETNMSYASALLGHSIDVQKITDWVEANTSSTDVINSGTNTSSGEYNTIIGHFFNYQDISGAGDIMKALDNNQPVLAIIPNYYHSGVGHEITFTSYTKDANGNPTFSYANTMTGRMDTMSLQSLNSGAVAAYSIKILTSVK